MTYTRMDESDAVQQLTNNKLIDLMSCAGDDHLEDGNEEARKVDRISKSGGDSRLLRQHLLMLHMKGM